MITSSHVVFRSQTNNTDNTNVCFPFYVSPALSQLASSQTCADYYQYKEIFSILSFSLCSTLQIIDTYSKKTELLMIQYPAPQVRPVGIFSTLFLKYQRHNIVDNRCIFKNDRMVDDILSSTTSQLPTILVQIISNTWRFFLYFPLVFPQHSRQQVHIQL